LDESRTLPTGIRTESIIMTKAMEIKAADFDVFRNDVFDIPEQECTNEIACSVETILHAIV
jgi:hypothetical protein